MKILITGSEGLIGSALQKRLGEEGIDVQRFDIAFDRANQCYSDVRDLEALVKAMDGCHGVVHLAAVSRVVWAQQNPDLCLVTNILGTQNVLNGAAQQKVTPWVLFSSSREVYGQQETLPVKEIARLKPMNVYARSKYESELKMKAFRDEGYQAAVVRFSNVYGSVGDHHDRVLPAFCRAAAEGGVIRIEGGENTFDFTHINDVTDGLWLMIKKLSDGETRMPVLHFVSGQPTTLNEAAEYASVMSSNQVELLQAPSRTYDVSKFVGDPKITSDYLDWSCNVTFQEGVKDLIDRYARALSC